MNSTALLNSLLALFQEKIGGADFRRAFPAAPGKRLPEKAVVTGEVDSETLKPGSQEVRLRFRIFLPEQAGAEQAEELFAAMCSLARESYPGFSAISRNAARRDTVTGLLSVACALSFLTQDDSGSGGDGSPSGGGDRTVLLGGMEYTATGVKTSFSPKGTELVSVGETVPFAVLNERTEYTVELEGIETAGLDRLAVFTARIGETVYQSCRWKSISDSLHKAAFISSEREEEP